jgi:hypothetical protein
MNRQSKFHSREEQQAGEELREQTQPLEFATPEAMLRHDALHTPVPPSVEQRLQVSVSRLPAPARPWWRRLFGL